MCWSTRFPLQRHTILALRRRVGYVIQEGGLFPHLSALGNLALLPHYLGWPRLRIEQRAAELANLVQLPASVLATAIRPSSRAASASALR